jgi:hypothetical protein
MYFTRCRQPFCHILFQRRVIIFFKKLLYFTITLRLFLMEGKQNCKHWVHLSDIIFQPNYTKLISALNSILMMEALFSSDTSVPTCLTTRCRNPKDHSTVTFMSDYEQGLDG